MLSVRPYDNFPKFPPLSAQICHSEGEYGGSPNNFFIGILIVCDLGAKTKFQNPSCLLSGRKVRDSERENERKKEKQAGAELCQAQVKLGSPASSLSLPFKIVLSFKIVSELFDKLSVVFKLFEVVFH
jgi:hypothetical protein